MADDYNQLRNTFISLKKEYDMLEPESPEAQYCLNTIREIDSKLKDMERGIANFTNPLGNYGW